jgi:hypothetical protein
VVELCCHNDIFFRRYAKNCPYVDEIRDLNHPKTKTGEASEQATRMLQRVWREVDCRLDISRVTNDTIWKLNNYIGCVTAQLVFCRLPTATAQVRSQVKLCGICGGQSDTGAGFLWVLQFPLPILIPPILPHSPSSTIRSWYNRPNSGRRTTQKN